MKKNIVFIGILFLSGCSKDFSPNGEYKDKLVVYAILSSKSDTQYVNVSATINPNSYDPLQPTPAPPITNAQVIIQQGSTQYIFHDTTITVKDSQGKTRLQKMYVSNNFHLQWKAKYTLSIQSPTHGNVSSQVSSIDLGEIYAAKPGVFSNPSLSKDIPLQIIVGENVAGYLIRILIEYATIKGTDTIIHVDEVPNTVLRDVSGNITERNFPQITYRGQGTINTVRQVINISFASDAYSATLTEIKSKYSTVELRFRKAYVKLSQFDESIYSYYNVANGFPGSASIRLDEPDYSNIQNGFGIFGTMSEQTQTHILPFEINFIEK